MMENYTETIAIFAAKIARKRLRKRIADRVRMAQTFAFNDLDDVGRSFEARNQTFHEGGNPGSPAGVAELTAQPEPQASGGPGTADWAFRTICPLIDLCQESCTDLVISPRMAAASPVKRDRGEIWTDGTMSRNLPNSLRGRRVLVAEDEFLICKLIGRMLQHLDCTVVGPAHNLSEVLQTIRTSEIDAALLDVQLGDDDVYPAAKELRRRNIPFVLETGYRDLDGSPQLLRDAPRLTKPFNEQQLVDILTAAFVHD